MIKAEQVWRHKRTGNLYVVIQIINESVAWAKWQEFPAFVSYRPVNDPVKVYGRHRLNFEQSFEFVS